MELTSQAKFRRSKKIRTMKRLQDCRLNPILWNFNYKKLADLTDLRTTNKLLNKSRTKLRLPIAETKPHLKILVKLLLLILPNCILTDAANKSSVIDASLNLVQTFNFRTKSC